MLEFVDPNEYRAFCFRGEGRCNIVISAKGRRDNIRIVWRLAKKRRSGLVNYKPKSHLINAYLEQFISPFLNNNYLIRAKLVHMRIGDLHQLAKIPNLPHNLKVENFAELADTARFPEESTRFPRKDYNGTRSVCVLEMLDATRIPRQLPFVFGPTLTLEIKPKQGFFQTHPGVDIPYCNNCILQIEKWRSADFSSMYDFCPLALYSGNQQRMRAALDSLIRDPHRNLRIFVDGTAVHDEANQLGTEQLDGLLFPGMADAANVHTLISAITCILAGIPDDQSPEFGLQTGSVLHDLLKAQRTDTVGIVRAYQLYKSLAPNIQRELRKKSNLLNRGLGFLAKGDARSMVERYLLAATMKDCSLMISIRLADRHCLNDGRITALAGGGGYVQVRGLDGRTLVFAYSIRIVDLDPKSAKNLENAYNRFMSGVAEIKANPGIHPPCTV